MNEEKLFTQFELEEVEGKKSFVATDETMDREGDILAIEGWDLTNFKRNPIMLWSHNPMEPNIGKWGKIRHQMINGKKKLTMEPIFHGITELSKSIAEMVDKGFMNTVSVGFRPYEKDGNTYTKMELLETSFVNIPANPEATTLALSKGMSVETMKTIFKTEQADTDETKNTPPPATQEQVEQLQAEIKRLEVAISSVNPAKSQESSLGKGRTQPAKSDGRKDIKRLMQISSKALSRALELEKKHNG